MPRGGKRPGAGRKPDSKSRRTVENRDVIDKAREVAKATNGLPHEILYTAAVTGKLGEETISPTMRVDCLKNAAPYYAPRLSTLNVDHGGEVKHKHDHVHTIDIHETARRMAYLLRHAEKTGEAPNVVLPAPAPEEPRSNVIELPVRREPESAEPLPERPHIGPEQR